MVRPREALIIPPNPTNTPLFRSFVSPPNDSTLTQFNADQNLRSVFENSEEMWSPFASEKGYLTPTTPTPPDITVRMELRSPVSVGPSNAAVEQTSQTEQLSPSATEVTDKDQEQSHPVNLLETIAESECESISLGVTARENNKKLLECIQIDENESENDYDPRTHSALERVVINKLKGTAVGLSSEKDLEGRKTDTSQVCSPNKPRTPVTKTAHSDTR